MYECIKRRIFMEQIALSRKYRPKNFQEGFIGQEHVAKMISYALENNKLGHSILLSGERGSGKTSTARIIARGLNCEKGVTSDPCGQCDYCKDNFMLVVEIDAASNRGVEEIRNLKESIKYVSQPGKFKVYIIDEVHMMTTEAFNALLKTLEEPPSNVVFILCTTNPEKLPATIISRVQHFKFGKIPVSLIKQHLINILHKENITDFDEEAITVIAEHANGGMRDSLTLLEQCLLLNEPLTPDNVYKIIGSIDFGVYLKLLIHISRKQFEEALKLTKDIVNQGVQPHYFYQDFIKVITNVILKKVYTNEDKELLKHITLNTNTLLKITEILQGDMKQTFLELSIIKIFELAEIKNIQVQNQESVQAATATQQQQRQANSNNQTHNTQPQKKNNEKQVQEFISSFLAKKVFELQAKVQV